MESGEMEVSAIGSVDEEEASSAENESGGGKR